MQTFLGNEMQTVDGASIDQRIMDSANVGMIEP